MTTTRISPQQKLLSFLKTKCPESTQAERTRFLAAYPAGRNHIPEHAARKLQAYLDWRARMYEHIGPLEAGQGQQSGDEIHWQEAVHATRAHADPRRHQRRLRSVGRRRRAPRGSNTRISQIVLQHTDSSGSPIRCENGNLLLHVLPARVDTTVASIDDYGQVLSLYLDQKFDRHSMEQFTFLLDVRPGDGWANPKAYNMIPFIRSVTHVLHTRFPGRLERCVVYPLPQAALWIWDLAKPILNNEIVASTILVGGSSAMEAAPPNQALAKFASESVLEQVEDARLAAFQKL